MKNKTPRILEPATERVVLEDLTEEMMRARIEEFLQR